MPLVSLLPDLASLTIDSMADYPVDADAAWRLWADPRLLEQWWAPPGFDCRIETHDLTPGGWVTYGMTGPDSYRATGWWRVVDVSAPRRLVFSYTFATGTSIAPDHPAVSTMTVTIADTAVGVRVTVHSTFPDEATMRSMLDMGVLEGMQASISQIDALL